MPKGSALIFLVILLIVAPALIFLILGQFSSEPEESSPSNEPQQITQPTKNLFLPDTNFSSSAKGVIQVKSPKEDEEITTPLTVSGFVYANDGTLTIKLIQQEFSIHVIEEVAIQISSSSEKTNFAETFHFGLPIRPQTYILEVSFIDGSSQGLDDKVTVGVNVSTGLDQLL